jgi:predicted HTH transcriptional regulator
MGEMLYCIFGIYKCPTHAITPLRSDCVIFVSHFGLLCGAENNNQGDDMTEKQIRDLIEQGEGQTAEFKPSLSQGKRLVQIIASFANSSGRHLLIGVRSDGSICGVKLGSRTLDQLSNAVFDNIEPEIYPKIEVVKVADKSLIVITVDESDEKPHLAYGKAFKRVGAVTKEVSRAEYERMLRARGEQPSEQAIVRDATLDDLDEIKVRTFLAKMENLMLSHGLEKPIIRATKSFFRTIFNGPGDNILELTPDVPEEDTIDLSHLNERQLDIIELIVNKGKDITTREYSKRFGISRYSAIRDLNGVVETGLVRKEGAGRGVKYVPAY